MGEGFVGFHRAYVSFYAELSCQISILQTAVCSEDIPLCSQFSLAVYAEAGQTAASYTNKRLQLD